MIRGNRSSEKRSSVRKEPSTPHKSLTSSEERFLVPPQRDLTRKSASCTKMRNSSGSSSSSANVQNIRRRRATAGHVLLVKAMNASATNFCNASLQDFLVLSLENDSVANLMLSPQSRQADVWEKRAASRRAGNTEILPHIQLF